MAETFAVVTGASSGIGYSLAKELAARGYDLMICSEGERLDAAAQELKSMGVQVTAVYADLATREGVDKAEGMSLNFVPGAVKGAMHEKQARPLDEKKRKPA